MTVLSVQTQMHFVHFDTLSPPDPLTESVLPLPILASSILFRLCTVAQDESQRNLLFCFTSCDPNCFGQEWDCCLWWNAFYQALGEKAVAEKKRHRHTGRHTHREKDKMHNMSFLTASFSSRTGSGRLKDVGVRHTTDIKVVPLGKHGEHLYIHSTREVVIKRPSVEVRVREHHQPKSSWWHTLFQSVMLELWPILHFLIRVDGQTWMNIEMNG